MKVEDDGRHNENQRRGNHPFRSAKQNCARSDKHQRNEADGNREWHASPFHATIGPRAGPASRCSALKALNAAHAARKVAGFVGQSTQLNLNYVRIGTNFAPLPPPKEQSAIAEYLDVKERESHLISHTIETQIATLTGYRKSLIHECVTGQRRISEADITKICGQKDWRDTN